MWAGPVGGVGFCKEEKPAPQRERPPRGQKAVTMTRCWQGVSVFQPRKKKGGGPSGTGRAWDRLERNQTRKKAVDSCPGGHCWITRVTKRGGKRGTSGVGAKSIAEGAGLMEAKRNGGRKKGKKRNNRFSVQRIT